MLKPSRETIAVDLAVRLYKRWTAPSLGLYLADAFEPDMTAYDPVKLAIEDTWPDVTVNSGMQTVAFTYRGDPATEQEVEIQTWHDRHLSRVVGRASSLGAFPGYGVFNGEYSATVENHVADLTDEPLGWFGKVWLTVLSVPDALRAALQNRTSKRGHATGGLVKGTT